MTQQGEIQKNNNGFVGVICLELRQGDCCEFTTSLNHKVRVRQPRTLSKTLQQRQEEQRESRCGPGAERLLSVPGALLLFYS